MTWNILSAVTGIHWPAMPGLAGAGVLALLHQLERSQWMSREQLRDVQRLQLGVVLRHAQDSVPFYRARWRTEPAAAQLEELPILSRRELQDHYAELKSEALPREHGDICEQRTSGSTGAPVRILKSALEGLLWNALTLRDHRWHRRDLRGKLAVIRRGAGGQAASWGSATEGLVETGQAVALDVDRPVDAQLDWLAEQDPDYLLTYPSLAGELAKRSLKRDLRPIRLREVRTMGESLPAEVRSLCRDAWRVPLTDVYSAEEVGYIALQCPEHEHYHVQSESVLVEVLDDAGQGCAPGQTGRIVVTSLHNFATPLIRYEIGDYAEVGEPCPCGRGLPVLRRILGRVRNMLVTASGERYWPAFGTRALSEIAGIRQHQAVQRAFDLVELRLVAAARLSAQEEERVRAHVLSRLPRGFRLDIVYREHMTRSASGKFEEFLCEVPSVAGR